MSTSIISEILHTRANGLMIASGNKVPSCRRMCVAKICDWVDFCFRFVAFITKHDKSAN